MGTTVMQRLKLSDALVCIRPTDPAHEALRDHIKGLSHWGIIGPTDPSQSKSQPAKTLFSKLRRAVDQTELHAWNTLLSSSGRYFVPAKGMRAESSIDYRNEITTDSNSPTQSQNRNRRTLHTRMHRGTFGMWMPIELFPVTQDNIMNIVQEEMNNGDPVGLFFDFFESNRRLSHSDKSVYFHDLWDIATGTRINDALVEGGRGGVTVDPKPIIVAANTVDVGTVAQFLKQVKSLTRQPTATENNSAAKVKHLKDSQLQMVLASVFNTLDPATALGKLLDTAVADNDGPPVVTVSAYNNACKEGCNDADINTKRLRSRWSRIVCDPGVAAEAASHLQQERESVYKNNTDATTLVTRWCSKLTGCKTFWRYLHLKWWCRDMMDSMKKLLTVRGAPKARDLKAHQDRINKVALSLCDIIRANSGRTHDWLIQANIALVASAKAQVALTATLGMLAEDNKARQTHRLRDRNREDEVRQLIRDMYNDIYNGDEDNPANYEDERLFQKVCSMEGRAIAEEEPGHPTPFYLGGLWRKLLAKAAGDTSLQQIFPIRVSTNSEARSTITGNMVRLSALAAKAVEADSIEAEAALQRADDRAGLEMMMESCLRRAEDGKRKCEIESVTIDYKGLFVSTTAENAALTAPLRHLQTQLESTVLHQQLWHVGSGQQLTFLTEGAESFGFKMNLILKGSAGSGKTRAATTYTRFLSAIGYLPAGCEPFVASNADVIGQWVGQTAPLVKKAVVSNLDGVLFLDEAYAMTDGALPGETGGFGAEFNGTLVERMSRFSILLIVVAAGYREKMETHFVNTNDGYARRFPTQIHTDTFVTINNLIAAVNAYNMFSSDTLTSSVQALMGDVNKYTSLNPPRYSADDILTAHNVTPNTPAAARLARDMFPSQFASVADVRNKLLLNESLWTEPETPATKEPDILEELNKHMQDPQHGLMQKGVYNNVLYDWKFGFQQFQAKRQAEAEKPPTAP